MSAPRIPPRFVPTLTTVLEAPEEQEEPKEGARPDEPAMAAADSTEERAPLIDPRDAVALGPAERLSELESFAFEEQLLHRVLQRVDLSLEERLSDAVSAAVQVQLDAMVPRLRGEIESVLRTLVTESLAHELREKPGSNPPEAPSSFG